MNWCKINCKLILFRKLCVNYAQKERTCVVNINRLGPQAHTCAQLRNFRLFRQFNWFQAAKWLATFARYPAASAIERCTQTRDDSNVNIDQHIYSANSTHLLIIDVISPAKRCRNLIKKILFDAAKINQLKFTSIPRWWMDLLPRDLSPEINKKLDLFCACLLFLRPAIYIRQRSHVHTYLSSL